MASIEFIQKRIAGKEAEIAKLEKKMERILKARESNYEENNPYFYSDYDYRATTRDLEQAKNALDGYSAQLEAENQKAGSRNVQVILDFLDNWKDQVYDHYMNSTNGLVKFYEESAEIKALWREEKNYTWGSPEWKEWNARKTEKVEEWHIKCHGRYEDIPVEKRRYRWESQQKVETGVYEWLKDFADRCSTLEEADVYLKKLLDEEAKHKYDEIIERTNAIVGQITDASGLSIGAKGELNGIIIGTDGKAKVETIGAGGYNQNIIVNEKHGQIYHFRTLIKPLK